VSATATVHVRNGLWNANGGFELPLLYATVAAALGFTGPGAFSLDRLFGFDLAGTAYGIGAIVLGVGAALIGLALRRPEPASRREAVSTETEKVAA
jgi:putative oxidoreductase